jgi:hypothetical protein
LIFFGLSIGEKMYLYLLANKTGKDLLAKANSIDLIWKYNSSWLPEEAAIACPTILQEGGEGKRVH